MSSFKKYNNYKLNYLNTLYQEAIAESYLFFFFLKIIINNNLKKKWILKTLYVLFCCKGL